MFDKWHFYFNKQAILLTNLDENGKSYEEHLPVKKNKQGEKVWAKSTKLVPTHISQIDDDGEKIEISEFVTTTMIRQSTIALKIIMIVI